MRAAITALKPIDDSLTTRAEMIARWKEASSRIKAAGLTYGDRVKSAAKERFSVDVKNQVIHSIRLRTNTSSVSYFWNGVIPEEWGISTEARLLTVRVRDVVRVVCEVMMIPRIELLSNRRNRHAVDARFVAMYVLREHSTLSFPQIGRLIGNRDHTTVMSGIAVVMRNPAKYKPVIRTVLEKLGGG